jgi:hypothetical protein
VLVIIAMFVEERKRRVGTLEDILLLLSAVRLRYLSGSGLWKAKACIGLEKVLEVLEHNSNKNACAIKTYSLGL